MPETRSTPPMPSPTARRYDGPELPVVELADFSEHRRAGMLWHYRKRYESAAAVDAYVRHASRRPCAWHGWRVIVGDLWAWRGSDNRYHLFQHHQRGSACLCAKFSERGLKHDQDGKKYVELDGEVADPIDVRPRTLLCPRAEGLTMYVDARTKLGRLKRELIHQYGRQCQACGLRPSVHLDHDHIDGLVRGLLCRNCNTHVDECPHLERCPWSIYLENPPLAHLNLLHPGPRRYDWS